MVHFEAELGEVVAVEAAAREGCADAGAGALPEAPGRSLSSLSRSSTDRLCLAGILMMLSGLACAIGVRQQSCNPTLVWGLHLPFLER